MPYPYMRPPRYGVSYSAVLAEAYASAPDAEIVFDTIELNHPSFKDELGNPIAVRVVNDHEPMEAYLEDEAPFNPGELVVFSPCYFQFTRPTETESSGSPEVELRVDNVSRILVPYLDVAKESRTPITLIWRPYLESDHTGPHMNPPLTLTLSNIGGDMNSLVARAGLAEITNRRFPASDYTARKFPGLVVR